MKYEDNKSSHSFVRCPMRTLFMFRQKYVLYFPFDRPHRARYSKVFFPIINLNEVPKSGRLKNKMLQNFPSQSFPFPHFFACSTFTCSSRHINFVFRSVDLFFCPRKRKLKLFLVLLPVQCTTYIQYDDVGCEAVIWCQPHAASSLLTSSPQLQTHAYNSSTKKQLLAQWIVVLNGTYAFEFSRDHLKKMPRPTYIFTNSESSLFVLSF